MYFITFAFLQRWTRSVPGGYKCLVHYIIMRKPYLAFALFLNSKGGHDTKYLFDVKASFPCPTQVQYNVLGLLKKPEINNITLLFWNNSSKSGRGVCVHKHERTEVQTALSPILLHSQPSGMYYSDDILGMFFTSRCFIRTHVIHNIKSHVSRRAVYHL